MLSPKAKAIILQPKPPFRPSPQYNQPPKAFQPPWQQQRLPPNNLTTPRCSVQEHEIDAAIAYLHDLCGGSPPPENPSDTYHESPFDGATVTHEAPDTSHDQPLLMHLTKKKPPT